MIENGKFHGNTVSSRCQGHPFLNVPSERRERIPKTPVLNICSTSSVYVHTKSNHPLEKVILSK